MSTTKVAPALLEESYMKSTDGTLSGTITGTYTLAGTPTITNPTITTPAITGGVASADPTDALGLATKQYVDATQQNPIINGNMDIWQRGPSFAAPVNIYTADRWLYDRSSTGVVTISGSTNVPTVAEAGVLFTSSLEVDVTTADASINAADYAFLAHTIEGYNWRHFAQRNFTLSFWVFSSKTGIHGVTCRNGAADRSYVAEYTVNAANTWEFKSITVLASPSAGTWNYTNGRGLTILFGLLEGTTNGTSTIGSWLSAAVLGSNNQVNVLDNVANFFRITGVKLELGSTATPIQFVPFEEELVRAKRYFRKSFNYATAVAQNAGVNTGEHRWSATIAGAVASLSPRVQFNDQMRGTPTIVLLNPAAVNAQVRNITDAADHSASGTETNSVSDTGFNIISTGLAGTAVGESLAVHWTADAEL